MTSHGAEAESYLPYPQGQEKRKVIRLLPGPRAPAGLGPPAPVRQENRDHGDGSEDGDDGVLASHKARRRAGDSTCGIQKARELRQVD